MYYIYIRISVFLSLFTLVPLLGKDECKVGVLALLKTNSSGSTVGLYEYTNDTLSPLANSTFFFSKNGAGDYMIPVLDKEGSYLLVTILGNYYWSVFKLDDKQLKYDGAVKQNEIIRDMAGFNLDNVSYRVQLYPYSNELFLFERKNDSYNPIQKISTVGITDALTVAKDSNGRVYLFMLDETTGRIYQLNFDAKNKQFITAHSIETKLDPAKDLVIIQEKNKRYLVVGGGGIKVYKLDKGELEEVHQGLVNQAILIHSLAVLPCGESHRIFAIDEIPRNSVNMYHFASGLLSPAQLMLSSPDDTYNDIAPVLYEKYYREKEKERLMNQFLKERSFNIDAAQKFVARYKKNDNQGVSDLIIVLRDFLLPYYSTYYDMKPVHDWLLYALWAENPTIDWEEVSSVIHTFAQHYSPFFNPWLTFKLYLLRKYIETMFLPV